MITINLSKAKTIAHDIRRKARDDEFAPFDNAISKQLPSIDVISIEESRQKIRDKYAIIQTQIDNADSVESIKSIIESI